MTAKKTFHYFKINSRLLDEDIKKSELWVYLTHCRQRGRKSKGYSIAGLNKVQEHFGNTIKRNTYDKCIESLLEKNLIKEVCIKDKKIYTGYYKTDTAVEIVEDEKIIQIPVDLIDKKIITNLRVKEVKDIFKLYSLYDPLFSHGGLSYENIKAIDNTSEKGVNFICNFGEGFNAAIEGKKAYKVNDPTSYIINNDLIKDIDIDKYIKNKLFKLKPVVIEYDPEDEGLTEIKREVFKNLVRFTGKENNYKYMTALNKNQKVIYVIEPVYQVINEVYKEYLRIRQAAEENAIYIYGTTDQATMRETKQRFIHNDSLKYFIANHLGNREDINIEEIYNLLNDIEEIKDPYIDLEQIQLEKNLVVSEIEREKEDIKGKNERAAEEGIRRRHTTSPRLKQLQDDLFHLEVSITAIEDLESEVIDLTPTWIFKQLLNSEIKYSD